MAARASGGEGGAKDKGRGGKAKRTSAQRPKKQDISYRKAPANYLVLSEDEKSRMLRRFVRIAASLEERRRLRITVVNRKAAAECAGRTCDYVEEAAYFASKQDLGPALSSAGLRSSRMDEPPKFQADDEKAGRLVLPDGAPAKAFVVYDFPRSIAPAWLHQVAQGGGCNGPRGGADGGRTT